MYEDPKIVQLQKIASAEIEVLKELVLQHAKAIELNYEAEDVEEAGMLVVECTNIIFQRAVNDCLLSQEEAEDYTQKLILGFMRDANDALSAEPVKH